eukprot:GEZU01024164.1.p1 GENE.GEZU01024164.1~~GEZU01024164.1.p1  ORF type:complete len:666 (+),score=156.76 GEZU01024164.1:301-2298(+)
MAQIAKDLCEKWDEMLGEQEKRLQRQQKKQELMQHDYSNNVPPETTLSVNLNDWISRVSFDTISLAGFGYPNNSVKGSPIMVRIVEHLLVFATIRAIVLPARIRNLFLVRKVLMRSSEKKLDRWKEMLSAIIANRQREMSKSVFSRSEASKQNKGGSSDSGSDNEESAQSAPPKALSQKKSDLLSFLMNAKDDEEQPYTLGELMADLSIFMFAGHETTSAVMAWCIYYLARYPEIQRRLHCEVDGILQDLPADGIPTYEMTKKMSYALCIMKEVMRLHPPAYTLVRTAMDDVELDWKDGKKLMVPKGAMVQVFAAQLFRDPRYWEEPDKFMPERFEKTPQDSPYYKYMHNPYIFFPFGVGQRSCVGSRFAELEVCLVLAMVCRRFWFSLDTTTTTTTTTTDAAAPTKAAVPQQRPPSSILPKVNIAPAVEVPEEALRPKEEQAATTGEETEFEVDENAYGEEEEEEGGWEEAGPSSGAAASASAPVASKSGAYPPYPGMEQMPPEWQQHYQQYYQYYGTYPHYDNTASTAAAAGGSVFGPQPLPAGVPEDVARDLASGTQVVEISRANIIDAHRSWTQAQQLQQASRPGASAGEQKQVSVQAKFWDSKAGTVRTVDKGQPTRLHKRKHQINQLAFDVIQREAELTEARLAGNRTKAETWRKYGWS